VKSEARFVLNSLNRLAIFPPKSVNPMVF